MQMRKGLAFGKEISTQSVSMFDASISHLRLQPGTVSALPARFWYNHIAEQ